MGINERIKLHGSLSNSCQDVQLNVKTANLLVAHIEKSVLKSLEFILLGTMNVCTRFHDSLSNRCLGISVKTKVNVGLAEHRYQSNSPYENCQHRCCGVRGKACCCWVFLNVIFQSCEHSKQNSICFHCIEVKAEISVTHILKIWAHKSTTKR